MKKILNCMLFCAINVSFYGMQTDQPNSQMSPNGHREVLYQTASVIYYKPKDNDGHTPNWRKKLECSGDASSCVHCKAMSPDERDAWLIEQKQQAQKEQEEPLDDRLQEALLQKSGKSVGLLAKMRKALKK